MSTNERKPAETTIDLIPQNGRIAFKLPVVSNRTLSGLHKTQKTIEEENKLLPKFVEIVAMAMDVYDLNIGDYVGLAPQSDYTKIMIEGVAYGLTDAFNVTMVTKGKLREEAIKKFEEHMKNNSLSSTPTNPSSIILDARKN